MKTFNVSAQLEPLLDQMSRDMAVPIEGLVNQALFNWAKLHGYLEPGAQPRVEALPGGTHPSAQKQRRIVLVVKGREVPVDNERFLVGRDVSCDLTIESPRISRQHAIFHVMHDGLELEDLGSSNGTWYEGQRIERKKLVHGDEVHIGDTLVRVEFR